MRVLILPDATLFTREHAMLGRLQVGLADEGVRVLQAIPHSAAGSEAEALLSGGVYAATIAHFDRGLPLSTPLRAAALARSIRALAAQESADRALDAVYAFGPDSWAPAARVARSMDAALFIELHGASLIDRAAALWRKASASPARARPMFVTPGNALAERLARVLPSSRIAAAPWGVYPTPTPHGPVERGKSLSVALLLSGRDAPAARAALLGLEKAAQTTPELHALVDADAARALDLWRWSAEAPGLRSRLTLCSDLEGRQDLLTEADVLLVPEALGEARALVLQAMADGMLVLARPDPLIDWLVPGETCDPLADATPDTIAKQVLALADDLGRATALRASAKSWVQQHRPASAQVRGLLGALTRTLDVAAPVSPATAPKSAQT